MIAELSIAEGLWAAIKALLRIVTGPKGQP
jgi:hypothetical protein